MQKSWFIIHEWTDVGNDWGDIMYDEYHSLKSTGYFFFTEEEMIKNKFAPLSKRDRARLGTHVTIFQLSSDGEKLERKDLVRLLFGRLASDRKKDREKRAKKAAVRRSKRKRLKKKKERERKEKIEQKRLLDDIGERLEKGDRTVTFGEIVRFHSRRDDEL